MRKIILTFVLILSVSLFAQHGTTGKIYGKITNDDGHPIPAASVVVIDQKLGAASDFNGDYFIINIAPGIYSLEAKRVGYKPAVKNNISVKAGESIRIDFKLSASNEYELDQKAEQFYLSKLGENQAQKLLLVKEEDKLKYQQILLETFYNTQAKEQNDQIQTVAFDRILQITKIIDETAQKYKSAENESKKSEYEKQIYDLLSKRFGLIEKKLEYKIQELEQNVDQLRKELLNLRYDKEKIIKGQFESFVK